MKTNFTKRLLGACRQITMVMAMISAIGIGNVAAQTCSTGSNTILDPTTCSSVISANDLVSGLGNVFFSVTLNGGPNLVVDPGVSSSITIMAPGSYSYQITDAGGCWGTFTVEDKSGPVCDVPMPTMSTDLLATQSIDCDDSDNWENYMDVLTAADFTDCSDDIAQVYFVDESVSECDMGVDELGTPIDGTYMRPANTEICAIYKRTWYAIDGDGNVSSGDCAQYVFVLRDGNLPAVANLVELECTADAATIAAAITPKIGSATSMDSISLTNGVKVCKYIATLNEGDKLYTCGKGYKQINTWSVIDWCEGAIVLSETQLLIVEDTTDPTTSASGTITFAANPFDCNGTVNVGSATGTDNCSPDALTWTTSISATAGLGYGTGGDVSTILNANGGSLSNVPIGSTVTVTWVAFDECGNQSDERTETFTGTEDNRGPVAICNDELNVSLVAANNTQQARVYAEDLDDTSRDNCGITKREVSLDGITYGEYVTLECSDLGSVTVYLKVSDAAGNSNVCWTEITVEDKSIPVVTPPANLRINCLEEIPAVVAPTIVSQGCIAPSISDVVESNVGIKCGDDIITRTWTVTPPANGAHIGSDPYTITQTITVTAAAQDWTATFPADNLTLECDGENTLPEKLSLDDIIVDNSCNTWVYSVVDKPYTDGSDVCRKIIRTYTLVNWCTVNNPEKPAYVIQDMTVTQDYLVDLPGGPWNLGTYGKFSYSQIFKINDLQAPTASIAATPDCVPSDDCNGGSIEVSVSNVFDNCGSEATTITSITLSGVNTNESDATPSDGSASFSNLAAGTYTVSATLVDACGNQTLVTASADVTGDCKKPTPFGSMTASAVMENCQLELSILDLVTTVRDNCDDSPESAIELLTDLDNSGSFDSGDVNTALFTNPDTDYSQYQTVNVTQTGVNALALWARDAAGNTQFTIILFDAQDNNPCTTGGVAAAIAGNITNEDNEDIDQVMVKFESSSQSLVEQMFSGIFNYSVPMHTDLTITPEKDLGYMNGVTTADLVKLQRHILGITSLSSAYQMIAADVNSDERVNTKDLLHISRMILGIYDEFPNSTSWKFVSKDHTFSNPSSPWGFPQAVNYAELESDVQVDFVGVKIGDLTGNASPSKLIGDDNTYVGEMTIAMDETTLTAGQSTVVEFKAADFTDFAGYQFTISLGDNVKLTEVTPGVLPNMTEEANFGLNRLSEGTITTSWSNANGVTLEDGAVLFSLTIESSETISLSKIISINSNQTTAEAYNDDLDVHTVGVQFNTVESAEFQLFQNQPNPFDGETMIGFNMPNAGVATLKVMNVAGQVLTTRTAQVVRGFNQISLNKAELNASGVLYYQIETENHSATKKMVILE